MKNKLKLMAGIFLLLTPLWIYLGYSIYAGVLLVTLQNIGIALLIVCGLIVVAVICILGLELIIEAL